MGSKRPGFGDGASQDFSRWFSKGYYHRYIVNYFTKYGDLTDLVIIKDW
ncbi:hypothetical protein Hanom_Chr05g00457051 [Helianthus anomalus]